jgi:glycosyltransferase involved in cell wall biosynthesis
LRPERLVVAVPGVAPSRLATGTGDGHRLLCLGVVAPHKGQDVLLAALASLVDRQWHCCCIGSLDVDRQFVRRLDDVVRRTGLSERVEFSGPQTGDALESIVDGADVLVHPARDEAYGMVVTEALAHGLPVITTSAGGLLESLGTAPGGDRPGLVVPVDDAGALAHAISNWLTDEALRERLRRAARDRRDELPSWSSTVQRIVCALGSVR